MPISRAPAVIMLTLLLVSAVQTADLGTERLYECQRTEQPPTIDGRLGDACWQTAAATGEFWTLRASTTTIMQTLVQAVYDEGTLYLGITCLEEHPERILANVRVDDISSVMGDDAVEIFLHPDIDSPDYYQLSANSIGTLYDGRGFDSSWNGSWRAAGTVGIDAWYLECAIDFSSFGRFGVPGAAWGFNVCRDRNGEGDTQWSCWSPSPGGFHQPEHFGRLIFGGEAGGADRAVLIECARAAQRSMELEARLNEALKIVRAADAATLPPEQRQALQQQVADAEGALQALRGLLEDSAPLDTRAWLTVNEKMAQAAVGVEEAAWMIRFERLLAD